MIRRWAWLTFVLLVAATCRDRQRISPSLHNLMAGTPQAQMFTAADQARNRGDYLKAIHLFDSLLNNDQLSRDLLHYARDNAQFCFLLAHDSVYQLPHAHDTTRSAPATYARDLSAGIIALRNGHTGSTNFHRVRQALCRKDTATFEYFMALELLGQSHRFIEGRMDSALYYFKEAFAIAKTYDALAAHRPRLQLEMAQVLLTQRDEVTGLAYVNEALHGQGDRATMVRCLIFKGTLFRKLTSYDSAEACYAQAEHVMAKQRLPELEPELLRERILMAVVQANDTAFHRRMNQLLACDAALLRRSQVSADRLYGYYHYAKGEREKSIFYYERAVKQFDAQRVPDLVLVMESFYALTEHYSALKKFDDAQRCAFRSLVFATSFNKTPYAWRTVMHPEVAGVLFNFVNYDLLAHVFLMRAREHPADVASLTKALSLYAHIDSLMLRQVRVVQEDAVINFLWVGHRIYSGGIEAAYALYHKTADTTYLGLAHQFMERSKALIIYRDILVRTQEYFPNVPADFRQRELAMKAHLSGLRKNTAFNSGEMMEAMKTLDGYYREMEHKYPDYFAAKYRLNIPSFQHFQQWSSSQHTAVVQYHTDEEYIYMLTYGALPRFERVPNDDRFRHALTNLNLQLTPAQVASGAAGRKIFLRHASFLYQQLIAPLHIVDSTLLIVPDGPLQYLPFELLASDTTQEYSKADFLVKKYTVSYSQSLKTYALTAHPRSRPVQKILAYAQGEGGAMVALPGTTRELSAIRQIFRNAAVTSRDNDAVTRQHFLQDLEKPWDLVHIGLHASSSASDRLDNKIVCVGDDGERAHVYGYEIVPLSIRAHTVVLTSCQSAFGPAITGEGTYSLARAFKQAGVSSVVSSLWDLADRSTADLTVNFYTHLSRGHSASESLTLAKRNYLSTADEITAHPYFWAAMICHGK